MEETAQQAYREFLEFCSISLKEENPKFLDLIKSKYEGCEEDFRNSDSMVELLRGTQKKMQDEESRKFVHLKDLITQLKVFAARKKKGKVNRKRKLSSESDTESERERRTKHAAIRDCSVVLVKVDKEPCFVKSEVGDRSDNSDDGLEVYMDTAGDHYLCSVSDGNCRGALEIAIADNKQIEMLKEELGSAGNSSSHFVVSRHEPDIYSSSSRDYETPRTGTRVQEKSHQRQKSWDSASQASYDSDNSSASSKFSRKSVRIVDVGDKEGYIRHIEDIRTSGVGVDLSYVQSCSKFYKSGDSHIKETNVGTSSNEYSEDCDSRVKPESLRTRKKSTSIVNVTLSDFPEVEEIQFVGASQSDYSDSHSQTLTGEKHVQQLFRKDQTVNVKCENIVVKSSDVSAAVSSDDNPLLDDCDKTSDEYSEDCDSKLTKVKPETVRTRKKSTSIVNVTLSDFPEIEVIQFLGASQSESESLVKEKNSKESFSKDQTVNVKCGDSVVKSSDVNSVLSSHENSLLDASDITTACCDSAPPTISISNLCETLTTQPSPSDVVSLTTASEKDERHQQTRSPSPLLMPDEVLLDKEKTYIPESGHSTVTDATTPRDEGKTDAPSSEQKIKEVSCLESQEGSSSISPHTSKQVGENEEDRSSPTAFEIEVDMAGSDDEATSPTSFHAALGLTKRKRTESPSESQGILIGADSDRGKHSQYSSHSHTAQRKAESSLQSDADLSFYIIKKVTETRNTEGETDNYERAQNDSQSGRKTDSQDDSDSDIENVDRVLNSADKIPERSAVADHAKVIPSLSVQKMKPVSVILSDVKEAKRASFSTLAPLKGPVASKSECSTFTKGSMGSTSKSGEARSGKDPKAGPSSRLDAGASEDEFEESKKATDRKENNKPNQRHVKKLEHLLESLRNEIEKCQSSELSLDDLDDENTAFIYEDKLKRKFVAAWNKLCEITKRTVTTGRPTERTIRYSGTRYKEINKRLEKFLNKRKVFPDFHDVKSIVKLTNKKCKLNMSSMMINDVAREAFVDIGEMLQTRRHQDFVATFGNRQTDTFIGGTDPYLTDPVLRRKLDSNRQVARSNLEAVISKYTKLQYERKDDDDDEDEDDSDEAEDESVRRKHRAKRPEKRRHSRSDEEDDGDDIEDKPARGESSSTSRGYVDKVSTSRVDKRDQYQSEKGRNSPAYDPSALSVGKNPYLHTPEKGSFTHKNSFESLDSQEDTSQSLDESPYFTKFTKNSALKGSDEKEMSSKNVILIEDSPAKSYTNCTKNDSGVKGGSEDGRDKTEGDTSYDPITRGKPNLKWTARKPLLPMRLVAEELYGGSDSLDTSHNDDDDDIVEKSRALMTSRYEKYKDDIYMKINEDSEDESSDSNVENDNDDDEDDDKNADDDVNEIVLILDKSESDGETVSDSSRGPSPVSIIALSDEESCDDVANDDIDDNDVQGDKDEETVASVAVPKKEPAQVISALKTLSTQWHEHNQKVIADLEKQYRSAGKSENSSRDEDITTLAASPEVVSEICIVEKKEEPLLTKLVCPDSKSVEQKTHTAEGVLSEVEDVHVIEAILVRNTSDKNSQVITFDSVVTPKKSRSEEKGDECIIILDTPDKEPNDPSDRKTSETPVQLVCRKIANDAEMTDEIVFDEREIISKNKSASVNLLGEKQIDSQMPKEAESTKRTGESSNKAPSLDDISVTTSTSGGKIDLLAKIKASSSRSHPASPVDHLRQAKQATQLPLKAQHVLDFTHNGSSKDTSQEAVKEHPSFQSAEKDLTAKEISQGVIKSNNTAEQTRHKVNKSDDSKEERSPIRTEKDKISEETGQVNTDTDDTSRQISNASTKKDTVNVEDMPILEDQSSFECENVAAEEINPPNIDLINDIADKPEEGSPISADADTDDFLKKSIDQAEPLSIAEDIQKTENPPALGNSLKRSAESNDFEAAKVSAEKDNSAEKFAEHSRKDSVKTDSSVKSMSSLRVEEKEVSGDIIVTTSGMSSETVEDESVIVIDDASQDSIASQKHAKRPLPVEFDWDNARKNMMGLINKCKISPHCSSRFSSEDQDSIEEIKESSEPIESTSKRELHFGHLDSGSVEKANPKRKSKTDLGLHCVHSLDDTSEENDDDGDDDAVAGGAKISISEGNVEAGSREISASSTVAQTNQLVSNNDTFEHGKETSSHLSGDRIFSIEENSVDKDKDTESRSLPIIPDFHPSDKKVEEAFLDLNKIISNDKTGNSTLDVESVNDKTMDITDTDKVGLRNKTSDMTTSQGKTDPPKSSKDNDDQVSTIVDSMEDTPALSDTDPKSPDLFENSQTLDNDDKEINEGKTTTVIGLETEDDNDENMETDSHLDEGNEKMERKGGDSEERDSCIDDSFTPSDGVATSDGLASTMSGAIDSSACADDADSGIKVIGDIMRALVNEAVDTGEAGLDKNKDDTDDEMNTVCENTVSKIHKVVKEQSEPLSSDSDVVEKQPEIWGIDESAKKAAVGDDRDTSSGQTGVITLGDMIKETGDMDRSEAKSEEKTDSSHDEEGSNSGIFGSKNLISSTLNVESEDLGVKEKKLGQSLTEEKEGSECKDKDETGSECKDKDETGSECKDKDETGSESSVDQTLDSGIARKDKEKDDDEEDEDIFSSISRICETMLQQAAWDESEKQSSQTKPDSVIETVNKSHPGESSDEETAVTERASMSLNEASHGDDFNSERSNQKDAGKIMKTEAQEKNSSEVDLIQESSQDTTSERDVEESTERERKTDKKLLNEGTGRDKPSVEEDLEETEKIVKKDGEKDGENLNDEKDVIDNENSLQDHGKKSKSAETQAADNDDHEDENEEETLQEKSRSESPEDLEIIEELTMTRGSRVSDRSKEEDRNVVDQLLQDALKMKPKPKGEKSPSPSKKSLVQSASTSGQGLSVKVNDESQELLEETEAQKKEKEKSASPISEKLVTVIDGASPSVHEDSGDASTADKKTDKRDDEERTLTSSPGLDMDCEEVKDDGPPSLITVSGSESLDHEDTDTVNKKLGRKRSHDGKIIGQRDTDVEDDENNSEEDNSLMDSSKEKSEPQPKQRKVGEPDVVMDIIRDVYHSIPAGGKSGGTAAALKSQTETVMKTRPSASSSKSLPDDDDVVIVEETPTNSQKISLLALSGTVNRNRAPGGQVPTKRFKPYSSRDARHPAAAFPAQRLQKSLPPTSLVNQRNTSIPSSSQRYTTLTRQNLPTSNRKFSTIIPSASNQAGPASRVRPILSPAMVGGSSRPLKSPGSGSGSQHLPRLNPRVPIPSIHSPRVNNMVRFPQKSPPAATRVVYPSQNNWSPQLVSPRKAPTSASVSSYKNIPQTVISGSVGRARSITPSIPGSSRFQSGTNLTGSRGFNPVPRHHSTLQLPPGQNGYSVPPRHIQGSPLMPTPQQPVRTTPRIPRVSYPKPRNLDGLEITLDDSDNESEDSTQQRKRAKVSPNPGLPKIVSVSSLSSSQGSASLPSHQATSVPSNQARNPHTNTTARRQTGRKKSGDVIVLSDSE